MLFLEAVGRKIGNENHVRFWCESCWGLIALKIFSLGFIRLQLIKRKQWHEWVIGLKILGVGLGLRLDSSFYRRRRFRWSSKIFSAQLELQNMLQTREQLSRRGIFIDNLAESCVFCRSNLETCSHIFSSCLFSYRIWAEVYSRLGYLGVHHHVGFDHFAHHGYFLRGKKFRKVRHITWCAVVYG